MRGRKFPFFVSAVTPDGAQSSSSFALSILFTFGGFASGRKGGSHGSGGGRVDRFRFDGFGGFRRSVGCLHRTVDGSGGWLTFDPLSVAASVAADTARAILLDVAAR